MYGTAKEKRMDWKASLIEEKVAIVWGKWKIIRVSAILSRLLRVRTFYEKKRIWGKHLSCEHEVIHQALFTVQRG